MSQSQPAGQLPLLGRSWSQHCFCGLVQNGQRHIGDNEFSAMHTGSYVLVDDAQAYAIEHEFVLKKGLKVSVTVQVEAAVVANGVLKVLSGPAGDGVGNGLPMGEG